MAIGALLCKDVTPDSACGMSVWLQWGSSANSAVGVSTGASHGTKAPPPVHAAFCMTHVLMMREVALGGEGNAMKLQECNISCEIQ